VLPSRQLTGGEEPSRLRYSTPQDGLDLGPACTSERSALGDDGAGADEQIGYRRRQW
jgi:hypothetical protein